MPSHRFGFHFVPERAAEDRAAWLALIERLPETLRGKLEMGERRPLLAVAAPFAKPDANETRRDDELAGLATTRALFAELAPLAASDRPINVLRSGQAVGRIEATGPDDALRAMLDEWTGLVEARSPEDSVWERPGYVSIWAGQLARDEFDKLMKAHYATTDGPISSFARAIRIDYYERDAIERVHIDNAKELHTVVGKLAHSASFLDAIPADARDRPVNCAVALYNADFSGRPRNAARNRLLFVGSYPFKKSPA